MDDDDVLAGVGGRLRALRRDSGTTLAGLAQRTGLSASTLSRLETGRLRPTLEQLLPLARAHGVTLDDLVNAPATGDPRVHLKPVRRHGLLLLPLSQRPGGIQSYKVIFPPAAARGRASTAAHEGFEWLYVLDGSVRLLLGEQDLTLRPGEAAEFDTRTPHWVGSADARPAEVLMQFSAQGERTHVATRAR